ncbi:MAG: hypothetical protein IKF64_00495 [Eubacterium sp.]|nr:hypothetical protein [Eubacterium sp.]
MKDKFIRVISPVALPVILIFDAAVIYYLYIAIIKVMADDSVFAAIFLFVQVAAVVFAVLTTREVLRHGVKFTENYIEFTALDSDNKVKYEEIDRVAVQRDTKASFTKNFVNRYSSLVFYLNDDTVLTVELGITTGRKLTQIENEINERIAKE